jgi:hypothetical protein
MVKLEDDQTISDCGIEKGSQIFVKMPTGKQIKLDEPKFKGVVFKMFV